MLFAVDSYQPRQFRQTGVWQTAQTTRFLAGLAWLVEEARNLATGRERARFLANPGVVSGRRETRRVAGFGVN